jgi:CO/xanthine dehydrogenase FAD-binding subunit
VDLETVTEVALPRTRAELPAPAEGDLFLAGGTWVFSVPQTGARRLVDLTTLGWPAVTATSAGLEVAATCTMAELVAFAAADPRSGADARPWPATRIFGACCDALRGSFKVQHAATVGGNLCLALPAAPMAALAAALDGTCVIWTPAGGERRVPAAGFVLGDRRTVLAPGELLRSILLPAAALRSRVALRHESLTPLGRSAALLVARRDADGAFVLTVTASTPAPVVLRFPAVPSPGALADALDAGLRSSGIHDDVHGDPAWRLQLTSMLAQELREELAASR